MGVKALLGVGLYSLSKYTSISFGITIIQWKTNVVCHMKMSVKCHPRRTWMCENYNLLTHLVTISLWMSIFSNRNNLRCQSVKTTMKIKLYFSMCICSYSIWSEINKLVPLSSLPFHLLMCRGNMHYWKSEINFEIISSCST